MKFAVTCLRGWFLVAAWSVTVVHAETNAPTLARICTLENKTAWVSVSGLCHVLDFYGLGKTDLPLFPSGESALKALTDEETARHFFGGTPFVKTKDGLRYALYDEYSVNVDVGEAHRDQCLAMFAALDLPLSTPVHLRAGNYSLADLLSEASASFDLKQKEMTWSALAFAKYIPPNTSWTNHLGQEIDFSKLVNALLAVDLNSQKCAGTHVFEALAVIEKANRKKRLLDGQTKARLDSYLKSTVEQIIKSQRSDGSWGKSWCSGVNAEDEFMSAFQISFLVTGHLVEIMNKLDPPLRPGDEVLVKASRWITNSISSAEIQPNGFWVCPFTHAAHGAGEILK